MVSKSHPASRTIWLTFRKTRSHDFRFISVFPIVVVDAPDGCNSWILVGRNLRAAAFFLIPVINATDKRGDQRHTGFGARHSLRKAEQERQLALNALFLENFGRPYTLPGARDFDQDLFVAYRLFSYNAISFRSCPRVGAAHV